MHPRSCARLAASAAILCGGLLAAQQPTVPTFRSRVDAIEIEMRVADSAGRPVTDLEASDVEVFEDGRRQQIVAFTRVSVPIVAPSVRTEPSWLPAPDVASNRIANSSRIFVLILDDLHVDRRNSDQVKKAARRFVEDHLQPGDLASVVYTGARPEAAQDFTTDPRLLCRAIDQFVGRKLPAATVVRMEHYNQFFRARGRPQFEDLRDPYDAERAFNARAAMGSIEAVALVLARVNGRRKAAILFSEGVDYDLSGLRSRGKVGGAAAGATVLPSNAPTGGSEVDAVGRTDVHSYAEDVLLSVQTAIGAAARANVALYGVDAHGDVSASVADLGAPVHDPRLGLTPEHVIQETRDAQESLAMLATNTGGFVALAPSDYDEVFGRIIRESSEYYVVAYSPWNIAPDGTYRDLTVNVNRPGVQVSARRGYYAAREPEKRPFRFVAEGISEETSALIMSPVPNAGLSLELQTIARQGEGKLADVIVTAQLDGRELSDDAPGGALTNTFEQALVAIDSGGRVHAATGRAVDVKLEGDARPLLRDSGYRIVSRVQLPPGRYQIRQALRERVTNRQGSVFADVEVPDFSKGIAMSSVLVTSIRAGAVPTSIDPETYTLLSVLPSVRRSFRSDDELIVVTEVYQNDRTRPIEVTTTLRDAADEERYRHATKVEARALRAAGGRYRHTLQVPLQRLSGRVVLSVEARQGSSARDVVTRRVPLAVIPAARP